MIDAHAHLLSDGLSADEIISNMSLDNLSYIINIGTNVIDSIDGQQLANKYEKIYTTVGVHPEYVYHFDELDLQTIDILAKKDKVVAIGEIGLDYHYGADEEEKQLQKMLFLAQIKIAYNNQLPFVIHCRDAVDDVLKILQDNKNLLKYGFCMHCYSEGAKYIQDFLNLGAYISFTGNITYKKSDRSFLKDIPIDKIMVETDCPYLAPEPVRGRVNQPKYVVHTAQKIADCLQMSLEEFEKITENNTKTFYNIK